MTPTKPNPKNRKDMNTSFNKFAALCRENTGRHMLDSGGAYGRWHEKPAIVEECPAITLDIYGKDVTASIETAHFLAEHYEVLDDIQSEFESWTVDREGDWFSLASDFMAERGCKSRARDNVYNGECDLTQVYVWEVWTPEDSHQDWLYNDDAITVIHVHTGCDVRGGYSSPVFCRGVSDYNIAVDHVAEYVITESHYDVEDRDERWRCGYASYPAGEMMRDIDRIFTHTVKDNTFIARLTSGEVVRIAAFMPSV